MAISLVVMGIHKHVIKLWSRREIDTLFRFSISRLLGYNPHFHNLSLTITVYAYPIQRKGQFVKDLSAVKCKYLILSVKKSSLREGTFFLGGGGLGNFGIFFQKKVLALPHVLIKKLLTPHF